MDRCRGSASFVSVPSPLANLSVRASLPHRCRVSRTARVRSPSPPPMRMGLIPFLPNWVTLAAWAYGAYRFYLGFPRTSYQSSFRVPLALAWPILFALNPSYRKNFTKTLKGSDDD